MATETSIRSYVETKVLPKYQDVDEEDAITLLTLLLETGILDPSRITNATTSPTTNATTSPTKSPFKRARKFDLKVDDDVYFECKGPPRTKGSIRKRITYLRLGGWRNLRFGGWRTSGYDFHTEAVFALLSKLECLETLIILRCNNFRFTDTIARFPKLKYLRATCLTFDGISTGSLDLLLEMGESNLEFLDLDTFGIRNEDELATFFFEIFPFFPKLKKFHVGWNKIDTFQGIPERIRNNNDNETQKAKNSRLRCLDLGNYRGKKNSKLENGTKDPKEVEAVKTILLAFRELSDMTGLWSNESSRQLHESLDAGISHQMEINFTGRILVESNEEHGATVSTTCPSSIHSPIPLSLWPTVLARTWKKEGSAPIYEIRNFVNADGIYYLLRHVRLLQEGNNRKHSRGNGDSNSSEYY